MKNLYCALFILFISGCATNPGLQKKSCPEGRTLLDGVCVTEKIADYVSCVRAKGAQLTATKNNSLSADAGYFAINASIVKDVSDKLEKKYTSTNKSINTIIEQCNNMINKSLKQFNQHSNSVNKGNLLKSQNSEKSILQTYSCQRLKMFQSLNGKYSTTVNFRNQSHRSVNIYWINYDGDEILYRSLNESENYVQRTYVSHPWVIRNDRAQCIAIFQPTKQKSIAIIQ